MSRLTLRGRDLDALTAQVVEDYGNSARIIGAERVTQGGIGGILARKYFELTVELAEGGPQPWRPATHGIDRGGIAALLELAEAADGSPGPARTPGETPAAPDFDAVLAEVASTAGLPPAAPRAREAPSAVPIPPAAAGDLILVVGLGQDAARVATALSMRGLPADVRAGGTLARAGADTVSDRRSALGARASAVNSGRAVVVAFGVALDPESGAGPSVETRLRSIGADWVWAVVDVSRKPQDTERWVGALRRMIGIDALAVVGSELTATPHTASMLGLPVGWSDGEPAVLST